jgi:zinc-binding in reverse transcriptase
MLYRYSTQHNCTVEEICHGRQWQLTFHTDSSEIQDQLQLIIILVGIHLQNRKDEIRWIHSWKFTASAYYEFIQNYSKIETSLPNLWTIKAPSRVTIFVWLMLRNAILMVNDLKRREWQLANIYHMCYNAEETVHRLFMDCQFIKEIRCYIHNVAHNHRFLSTNYRSGQCYFILNMAEDKRWKRMKVVSCFVIWRERCTRIFWEENNASLTMVKETLLEFKKLIQRVIKAISIYNLGCCFLCFLFSFSFFSYSLNLLYKVYVLMINII